MAYKALLIDFDGCLVRTTLAVSERVKKSITSIAGGTFVSLATGRGIQGTIQRIINEVPLSGLQIIQGGAVIYDASSKRVVWQVVFSPKIVKSILDIVQSKNLLASAIEDGEVYTNNNNPKTRFDPTINYRPLADLPNQSVTKIVINAGSSPADAGKLEHMFAHRFPSIKTIRWGHSHFNKYGIDITAATKLEGVHQYLKMLKLKPEEIVAVGDSYNDFPLLMAAGAKVAMGNAIDEIQKIADYIAPSVDNDGLVWVIEKFF